MKKLLLLALLAATPTFAQQHGSFDPGQLDMCAGYAINYALMVATAHEAKDRAEFDKFVQRQIDGQRGGATNEMTASIHKFAEEAWRNRDVSPTMAGQDWFHQCEVAVFRAAVKRNQ